MKTSLSIFIILIFLATTGNFAMAKDEDLLQQATFVKDSHSIILEERPRSLGIAVSMDQWGLSYRKNIAPEYNFLIEASRGQEIPVLLGSRLPEGFKGNAELKRLYSHQIFFGADKRFHLTDNKSWGVLLGLGLGYNQSSYESTYYPELCFWGFCGYDSSKGVTENLRDEYAFVSYRVGVIWREASTLGGKGDIILSLNPLLARTPRKFVFFTPRGDRIEPEITGSFVLEAMIEI